MKLAARLSWLKPRTPSEWSSLTLVFMAAAVVRLAMLIHYGLPAADRPWGAEVGFIAANLAEGRGYSSPFGLGATPTAWIPPAVPALWAVLFRLFGVFSRESLIAVYALQLVASSLACVVYALIIRALWRQSERGSSRIPLLIALVVATWPPTAAAVRGLWYFPYQELLLAMIVALGGHWLRNPDLIWSCALGATGGLTALVSPIPMPVFLWVLLWGTLGIKGLPATMRRYAIVALVLALGIAAPWVVRNLLVLEALVPLKSGFGLELHQGNNPLGGPIQRANSPHPMGDPAERKLYDDMGEIEYDRYSMQRAIAFISANPVVTLKRIGQRIYVYWLGDLLSQWRWVDIPPWWERGTSKLIKGILRVVLSILPLALLLLVIAKGYLQQIRGKAPIVGLLLLLPIPYYVAHVGEFYAYQGRHWLVILVAVGVGMWLQDAQRTRAVPL